jgi:hypothetical protein
MWIHTCPATTTAATTTAPTSTVSCSEPGSGASSQHGAHPADPRSEFGAGPLTQPWCIPQEPSPRRSTAGDRAQEPRPQARCFSSSRGRVAHDCPVGRVYRRRPRRGGVTHWSGDPDSGVLPLGDPAGITRRGRRRPPRMTAF